MKTSGSISNGDPNFVYAYVRMPIGTDQRVTDSYHICGGGPWYKWLER